MSSPAFHGWLLTHDMCATRFSASRRNGFLRIKPLCLALLLASAGVSLTSITAQAAPTAPKPAVPSTTAPDQNGPKQPDSAANQTPASTTTPDGKPHGQKAKKLTVEEQITQLSEQLAHAKTPEEAHALETMLESLRSGHLSPTTQLLLRRAQKDLATEKPDDAVEDLGDAIALQPDKSILWRSRAQMRLAAGDLAGSVKDLGEALQRDPKDAQAWALLSTVEEHRKDGPAALKAWQKVLELNPMADKNHKHLDALHIKAFGQPT